jgi:hypothetical protein
LHECTQYFEVANWGGDCVRISWVFSSV